MLSQVSWYAPPTVRFKPVAKNGQPEDPLQLSPLPLGFKMVESADGSMAPRCPSWVKTRLENNHVRLIAIRHGQSQANADSEALGQPLLYGQSESPLTDKGREQARNCAQVLYTQLGGDEWMKKCLQDPSQLPLFVSSSVSRAMESAQILADHLKAKAVELGGPEAAEKLASALIVESEPRLKETNFGRFEKRPLPELEKAYPDFVSHWRPSQGLGTDFLHRFPGGESRADVMIRLTRFLEGLAQKHPGRTVVMMSHGESILATRATLGLVPVQEGKVRAETGVINNATPYWLVGNAPRAMDYKPGSCPPHEL